MEEDLLAEVQRLRAENDYLKNLQALVLEDERRQRKKRIEFYSRLPSRDLCETFESSPRHLK